MKTTRILSLALVATLATAIPAGAGARKVRPLAFTECYDQAASMQIPHSQAQAFLPEGFTATGGPADQSQVVHMYVTSFVCGGEVPTLEMSKTYVSVDPPAHLRGETSAEYFLIDVAASGPARTRLSKFLCLGSTLEEADIEATQAAAPSSSAPGAGTTTIESPSLSASITVAGAGSGLSGVSLNRWFFQNEAGETDYYDTFEDIQHVNLGSGEIHFGQAYQGLPLASPAFSLYRLVDARVYPSSSCARPTFR